MSAKCPLTVTKIDKPFITEHALVESFDRQDAYKLLYTPKLLPVKDDDHWLAEFTKHYKTTFDHLKDYVNMYDSNLGGVCISYRMARHGYGRPFPVKALGFTAFVRSVRHTIASNYYDIDLKNAQPSILYWVLTHNGLPVPKTLEFYVQNRCYILAEHMRLLNVPEKWMVKQLFISLFFMGTYYGWRLRMKKLNHDVPEKSPPYVEELSRDLADLAQRMRHRNPELYKVAANKRKQNGETEQKKIIRTFLALWCQTYEFNIVNGVLEYLHQNTTLLSGPNESAKYASYEFDGFKLLRSTVDAYEGGIQEVLRLANNYCLEVWNLPLIFEVKEMDEGISLVDVAIPDIPKDEGDVEEYVMALTKSSISHFAAVQVIMDTCFKDDFVYVRSINEWYTWDGNTWEKNAQHLMSQFIDIILDYFKKTIPTNIREDAKVKKAFFSLECKLGQAGFFAGVEKVSKIHMSLVNKDFDGNVDILNFDNGILDICNKTFRERQRGDFVQLSCRYDLAYDLDEPEYEKDIMDVICKIHPDPELREFFLYCLASGLSGRNTEKFLIYNGGGRNGKSLMTDCMELLLGDYFTTCPPALLIENQKNKSSGESNSVVVALDKKRYIVCSEPPKNIPIQNSVIKLLTGNSSVKGRALYKEVRNILLHGTWVLETNSIPNLAEAAETADVERLIDLLFGSLFTSNEAKWDDSKHIYRKDPGLKVKDWWITRRNAFMKILIRQLFKLHDHNYDLGKLAPKAVLERTYLYTLDSHIVYRLFRQIYCHRDEIDTIPYEEWDTAHTLQAIIDNIKSSEHWYHLPAYVRNAKEQETDRMKNWFKNNDPFASLVYVRSRQNFLKDYRKRPYSLEDAQDDTTTDLEIRSQSTISHDDI